MMRSLQRPPTLASTLAGALFAALAGAPPALAQPIDYDPQRAAALRACDEHQHRGRSERARECYLSLLGAPSLLDQAEAAWALDDPRRANELFRRAVQAQPRAVRPRVRWGRLFLATHQYAEAAELFREALEIEPAAAQATLGLALVFAEKFDGRAKPLLAEALAQDDSLPDAHLLAARMAIEEGRLAAAERSLDRAQHSAAKQKSPPLEIDAARAALALAREDKPDALIARVLDYNPRFGGVFEQLAHFEVMRRRYRDATALLRRAVAVQPELWSAHAELGANLLRAGELTQARTHLMRAYEGDPYRPTTVNSLRLLDRMDEFVLSSAQVRVGGEQVDIRLRLHPKEADVLRPYLLHIAKLSVEQFSHRYGFTLREPVTIELYPDHDDFAVRVAALPGIGLLGVTFGYLIAMDSPSGRAVGEFHWGGALWHEMAHVFTLEATDHRVPRWLSEGISMFEEWRTGPTPGLAAPPLMLAALAEKKFLPLRDLDAGFIRPGYPEQVQVSYLQAGLVCLFIEQRWGFERLAALLRQFTRRTTTPQAIEAVFRISPEDFDAQFDAFVRARFDAALTHADEWRRLTLAASQAVEGERWAEAVQPARRAVAVYPEHVGPGSPHLLLARALEKLGRRAEAIAALEAYRRAGGWDPLAMRDLARWLDDADRKEEATQVLIALNYVSPFETELHAHLGERLLEAGRPEDALVEFRVLLALAPHDPAPGRYGAARALHALGDRVESRRELLDALASAPHYKPAQEFLLQIVEERTRNE